jgi:hypothetical protein
VFLRAAKLGQDVDPNTCQCQVWYSKGATEKMLEQSPAGDPRRQLEDLAAVTSRRDAWAHSHAGGRLGEFLELWPAVRGCGQTSNAPTSKVSQW